MTTPAEVQRRLRGTQSQLYSTDEPDPTMGEQYLVQPGGWTLPELFDLPLCMPGDPVDPRWQSEAQIETFAVDTNRGTCTPMGDGPGPLWWQSHVDRFVAHVQQALASANVRVAVPATVTASVTVTSEVNAEPHLDDAGLRPDAGVGVVAIAATGAGPRALVGAIKARPGDDLSILSPQISGWFEADAPNTEECKLVHYPANRISVFTRFGQVHAGPSQRLLEGNHVHRCRTLLVYRADTEVRNGA